MGFTLSGSTSRAWVMSMDEPCASTPPCLHMFLRWEQYRTGVRLAIGEGLEGARRGVGLWSLDVGIAGHIMLLLACRNWRRVFGSGTRQEAVMAGCDKGSVCIVTAAGTRGPLLLATARLPWCLKQRIYASPMCSSCGEAPSNGGEVKALLHRPCTSASRQFGRTSHRPTAPFKIPCSLSNLSFLFNTTARKVLSAL